MYCLESFHAMPLASPHYVGGLVPLRAPRQCNEGRTWLKLCMLNQLSQKLHRKEANARTPQGPSQNCAIVQETNLDNNSLTYYHAKPSVSYDFTHLSSVGCILLPQTLNMMWVRYMHTTHSCRVSGMKWRTLYYSPTQFLNLWEYWHLAFLTCRTALAGKFKTL